MKTEPWLLAILASLLPSCIGGGVMRKSERPMTAFNIEPKVRVIHGGNQGRNPSGEEIESAWGEPDRRERSGSETVWTYDTRKSLQGGLAFMGILPVPLLAPTKPDGIDFYFQGTGKTPWKAVEWTTSMSGGYVDLTADNTTASYHKLGD